MTYAADRGALKAIIGLSTTPPFPSFKSNYCRSKRIMYWRSLQRSQRFETTVRYAVFVFWVGFHSEQTLFTERSVPQMEPGEWRDFFSFFLSFFLLRLDREQFRARETVIGNVKRVKHSALVSFDSCCGVRRDLCQSLQTVQTNRSLEVNIWHDLHWKLGHFSHLSGGPFQNS